MHMSTFVHDGKEGHIQKITPFARINHNYHYVVPEKHLALEGSRISQESSLSNVTTPIYSAPPPIDCESLEYQHQYNMVNHNLKIFSFFVLILLVGIFGMTFIGLSVDLKLKFVTQFIEGNTENGSENKVELSVQPDLSLNLTAHQKTSSSSAPYLEAAGIAEKTGSQTWNLNPWIRDW